MSILISSTFSINMLASSCRLQFKKIERDQFIELAKKATLNHVNPRHSTAALVDSIEGVIPCTGGFASLQLEDIMIVILPPREFMSRSGEEVSLDDLSACQFWLVCEC